ncbi:MAG: DUF4127 family protein [bacterium]|nr:DUF4127 family protein [bacterium]
MSDKIPQILIIPIDNRPVCYDLPMQAAEIFDGVKVLCPNYEFLGDLNNDANIKEIQKWTKKTVQANDIDIAIIALDTIAYGGLIPSRRTTMSFEDIKENIDDFFKILKKKNKKMKIYAVSSIMRISNNNINEEEKSYWDKYGRDLFRYSYLSHKLLRNYDVELEAEMIKLAKSIPFEVIDDYLDTRKRNYDINSYYIDLVKSGTISRLVFSQDDAAEFGFNIEEKELLWKQSIKEIVSPKVTIKTGADEMIISLLSRALCDFYGETIGISPEFFDDEAKKIISRYEDVSVEKSANAAIELCGGQADKKADLKLVINAPNQVQDEISLGIFKDSKSTHQADALVEFIKKSGKKYIVADVKNANGADNHLVEKFIEHSYDTDKFYGFGAWNTTGNTLGTVVAIAIIKELAKKYGKYNEEAFKKTQYIRLLDDWAYQSNVRKILRSSGETKSVSDEMQPYKEKISAWLNYDIDTYYSFPWERTFEIKIEL